MAKGAAVFGRTLKSTYRPRKVGDDSSSDSSSDSGDDTDAEMAKAEALWDERIDLSKYHAAGPENQAKYFSWRDRDGRWTAIKKGIGYDSFRAKAACLESQHFCAFYGLKASKTWSIRRYTEDACITLCRAWCRRLFFFFQVWQTTGMSDPAYKFTEAVCDAFAWDAYFLDWCSGALSPIARKEVEFLQTLKPRFT